MNDKGLNDSIPKKGFIVAQTRATILRAFKFPLTIPLPRAHLSSRNQWYVQTPILSSKTSCGYSSRSKSVRHGHLCRESHYTMATEQGPRLKNCSALPFSIYQGACLLLLFSTQITKTFILTEHHHHHRPSSSSSSIIITIVHHHHHHHPSSSAQARRGRSIPWQNFEVAATDQQHFYPKHIIPLFFFFFARVKSSLLAISLHAVTTEHQPMRTKMYLHNGGREFTAIHCIIIRPIKPTEVRRHRFRCHNSNKTLHPNYARKPSTSTEQTAQAMPQRLRREKEREDNVTNPTTSRN